MPMQFTDAVAMDQPRITRDGYLVCDARIARTGIQEYSGSELGRRELGTVRVYRPEAAVFDAQAMGSFAHRPVTIDHPSEQVGAKNWRDHSVGMTGDTVTRDGEHVRVAFTLMDQAAIDAVQAGRRELSCGYTCELLWDSGTTPSGETYDAVQTAILGNHLAIVDRGRAGSSCRIGDSWTSSQNRNRDMPDMALRTVTVDGLSISTTDQGAQVIERLQGLLTDSRSSVTAKDAELARLTTAHASAVQAKDGQIAALESTHRTAIEAKDGEIAALNAKLPDAGALDALIADRSRVIDAARKILGDGFDPKGKSDADIRRAAVGKRLGDGAITGKSDDYITAAFDTLTAVTTGSTARDPVRDALRSGGSPAQLADVRTTAHDEYRQRLESGWRAPVAKEAV